MENIPTAEEFLHSKNYWHSEEYENLLIEFAKLHVEAQKEAIKKNIKQKIVNPPLTRDEQYTIIDKQSIDNAYPEELIK